jgi:hypothetical protein
LDNFKNIIDSLESFVKTWRKNKIIFLDLIRKLEEQKNEMVKEIKLRETDIDKLTEDYKEHLKKHEDKEQRLERFKFSDKVLLDWLKSSKDNPIFYQLCSKVFDLEFLKDKISTEG